MEHIFLKSLIRVKRASLKRRNKNDESTKKKSQKKFGSFYFDFWLPTYIMLLRRLKP